MATSDEGSKVEDTGIETWEVPGKPGGKELRKEGLARATVLSLNTGGVCGEQAGQALQDPAVRMTSRTF